MKTKYKQFIAHRGYSTNEKCVNDESYRENTVYAIKKGVEHGINKFEVDLQLTKDNKIVIFHNYYIEINKRSYLIKDLTEEGFYDLLSPKRKKESDPPEIFGLLEFAKSKNLELNLEVKFPVCVEEFLTEKDYKKFKIVEYLEVFNKFFKIALSNYSTQILFVSCFSSKLISQLNISNELKFFISEGKLSKSNVLAENDFQKSVEFCNQNNLKGIVYNVEILKENLSFFSYNTKDFQIGVYNYETKTKKEKIDIENNLDLVVDFYIVDVV